MIRAMAVSSDSFTGVDLSRIPAPGIIETLDFEAIVAAALAQLQVYFPSFDATVESDPIVKVVQLFAWREMILRQRVNDAARAVMVAFAGGADLDQLGAIFGVSRREITPADPPRGIAAVMESDSDLRRRILLAPDSYSVAGPTAAYVFHALSASGDVADASATSPAPGEVLVSVLSIDGDGTAPQALLDQVEAAVGGDDVRPLTDHVTVQSAEIVDFAIAAQLTLYAGPDADLILGAATAGLQALLTGNRRIGRDITRSALFSALHVAGVQNVDLVEPAADIVIAETQAAFATAIDLTIAGTAA